MKENSKSLPLSQFWVFSSLLVWIVPSMELILHRANFFAVNKQIHHIGTISRHNICQTIDMTRVSIQDKLIGNRYTIIPKLASVSIIIAKIKFSIVGTPS